jgi:hypothetical protein
MPEFGPIAGEGELGIIWKGNEPESVVRAEEDIVAIVLGVGPHGLLGKGVGRVSQPPIVGAAIHLPQVPVVHVHLLAENL